MFTNFLLCVAIGLSPLLRYRSHQPVQPTRVLLFRVVVVNLLSRVTGWGLRSGSLGSLRPEGFDRAQPRSSGRGLEGYPSTPLFPQKHRAGGPMSHNEKREREFGGTPPTPPDRSAELTTKPAAQARLVGDFTMAKSVV